MVNGDSTPGQTIGQTLLLRRHALRLDQGRAATLVGISRSTYAAYERDARRLLIDVLPAVADFLNVDRERILELYGATCVAQADATLREGAFTLTPTNADLHAAGATAAVREDDMSVVKRVYFDAKGAHEATPTDVTIPTPPVRRAVHAGAPLTVVTGDAKVRQSNDGGEKKKKSGNKKSQKKRDVKGASEKAARRAEKKDSKKNKRAAISG